MCIVAPAWSPDPPDRFARGKGKSSAGGQLEEAERRSASHRVRLLRLRPHDPGRTFSRTRRATSQRRAIECRGAAEEFNHVACPTRCTMIASRLSEGYKGLREGADPAMGGPPGKIPIVRRVREIGQRVGRLRETKGLMEFHDQTNAWRSERGRSYARTKSRVPSARTGTPRLTQPVLAAPSERRGVMGVKREKETSHPPPKGTIQSSETFRPQPEISPETTRQGKKPLSGTPDVGRSTATRSQRSADPKASATSACSRAPTSSK
jgi:hypothetical protein